MDVTTITTSCDKGVATPRRDLLTRPTENNNCVRAAAVRDEWNVVKFTHDTHSITAPARRAPLRCLLTFVWRLAGGR